MLQRLSDLPEGIEGFRASGMVERQEYAKVLLPIIEDARRGRRRLRLVLHLGPELQGFKDDGAWQHIHMGLVHLHTIERLAVVGDPVWLREATRFYGAFLPFPVQSFSNAEWQSAMSWLGKEERAASISQRMFSDLEVLLVEPVGRLGASDFEELSLTVYTWLETHRHLQGMVIHAEEFTGWDGLAGLLGGIRFAREHHRNVRRVAIAADGHLAEWIARIAPSLVQCEIQHFPYEAFDDALAWAHGEPTGISVSANGIEPTVGGK